MKVNCLLVQVATLITVMRAWNCNEERKGTPFQTHYGITKNLNRSMKIKNFFNVWSFFPLYLFVLNYWFFCKIEVLQVSFGMEDSLFLWLFQFLSSGYHWLHCSLFSELGKTDKQYSLHFQVLCDFQLNQSMRRSF